MSSTRRRDARSYHTRFGWWVMTHERGGNALVGAVAAVVLAADLAYAIPRWRGSFATWFLAALLSCVVLAVIALLILCVQFAVEARVAARRRQRAINGVALVFILGLLLAVNVLHGNSTGLTLGLVAACGGYFVAFTSYWLTLR